MSGVNDDHYVHYYIQQQNTSIAQESFLSTSAPVSKQWRTDDSSLRGVYGKTLLSIKQSWEGLSLCDITQTGIWDWLDLRKEK